MIRKATLQDIPGILELVQDNLGTLLPRSHQDYVELIDTTWVADDDGKIVGSAVLEVYSPKIAEIRSFVVHKDYRGQGVGKGLISTAVDAAQSSTATVVIMVIFISCSLLVSDLPSQAHPLVLKRGKT